MSRLISVPIATQHKWEYDEHKVVVSRYELGPLLDFLIPYIWVTDEGEMQRVPLFGDVFMELTREKFCISCFRNIVSDMDDLCEECEMGEFGIFHRCVIKDDDTFRSVCTRENPACKISWATRYCYEEHVVYIGTIGDLIKVGVTKLSKYGQKENFLNRLLEQGLLSVVILRGKTPLSLLEAQEVEEAISLGWGISEKMNFASKVAALNELTSLTDGNIAMLDSIAEDIIGKLREYELEVFRFIELGNEYMFPLDWMGDVSSNKFYISGKIIGFVGNVLFIEADNRIYAYNASNLVGRGIIDAAI